MTKICGVVSDRREAQAGQHLEAVYQASWHDGYRGRETWRNELAGLGHFTVGSVNLEPQPLHDPASQDVAVYCGKIVAYEPLQSELAARGVTCEARACEARLLLRLLRHCPIETLARVNGNFSFAAWNDRDKALHVVSDRYGFRPIFYYHNPRTRTLVFSSDLRGVIQSGLVERKDVNWDAAATFMHFGHHLGNQTFLQNVLAMPAASVLRFQDNTVRIDPYWSLDRIHIDERMTYDDAMDGTIELFAQSIRRRVQALSGRTIVLLSGGKDSRHIAAEMKRQGVEFTTYTTAGFKPTNPDMPLAERVACVLDIQNTRSDVFHGDFIRRSWRQSNSLIDYEADLHQWMLPLVESLPTDVRFNFDGLAGDITLFLSFTDERRLAMARADDTQGLAEAVVGRVDRFPGLRGELRQRLQAADVVGNARREMDRFRGSPYLFTHFILANRTRRAISALSSKLISLRAESFCPFVDNDLVDFTLSIPPEMKVDHKFHRNVLDRAFPQLKDIPVTKEIAANAYPRQDGLYYRQRRHRFLDSVSGHYLRQNWLFRNRYALPRVLKDGWKVLARQDGPLFIANPAYTTFFEFLGRYFPDGL